MVDASVAAAGGEDRGDRGIVEEEGREVEVGRQGESTQALVQEQDHVHQFFEVQRVEGEDTWECDNKEICNVTSGSSRPPAPAKIDT